jgi:hypothetical protein
MDQSTFTPVLDVVAALPDRCDRCDAAAKLRMTLAAGTLAFCGHHANANADMIVRTAVRVAILAEFIWTGAAALGASESTVDERVGTDPATRAERSFRNSR